MADLTLIGYWSAEGHPEYPDPQPSVDRGWDDDERHAVSTYFASGTIARTAMGYSPCRFCGLDNGDMEFTDGTYIWPSGLVHYIDVHGVRLPNDVVAHALRRLDEIEASNITLDWWLTATRA